MPKIVDRDAMQAAICEGARKTFIAHGYHGTPLDKVAEEIGIAKGTIYLYFKTKQALADALGTLYFEAMSDGLKALPRQENLDAFLGQLVEWTDVSEDQAAFVPLFFEMSGPSLAKQAYAGRMADVWSEAADLFAGTLSYLQTKKMVRDDLDTARMGRVLVSMMDGIILHRSLFTISAEDSRAMAEELMQTLHPGLLP